jgi:6-phosphofructokinase
MSTPVRTIGILTGGGDCPGLNAVIRAVVRAATLEHGWTVLGIPDGYDGLIFSNRVRPLMAQDIAGILPRGGTILGTSNRGNPFEFPVDENGVKVKKNVFPQLLENYDKVGLDALVLVGGDGTMKIGLEMFRNGKNVVGVPKTIDNDLSATEVTFGFDTALHTATDAIDKLHSTARGRMDRAARRDRRRGGRHPDPGDSLHPGADLRQDRGARPRRAYVQHRGGGGGLPGQGQSLCAAHRQGGLPHA